MMIIIDIDHNDDDECKVLQMLGIVLMKTYKDFFPLARVSDKSWQSEIKGWIFSRLIFSPELFSTIFQLPEKSEKREKLSKSKHPKCTRRME